MTWWRPTTWGRKTLRPADLHAEFFGTAASAAGVRVTAETMLQAATSLACARVIAEGIAQVPLRLFRARPGGGADPATDHPLYETLALKPNRWLTSFEWRETAGLHLAIGYRAFAYVNRIGNARTRGVELLPLLPSQVRVDREDGWRSRYFVRMTAGGDERELSADQILHLKGPSWDNVDGLDGVRLAREAVGLSLATEEHGARMFSNGATLGGILSTDAPVPTKEQRKALRESWEEAQSGLKNAYKTAFLYGGLKWTARGQPNDQAQFIELRRFQVAEVCRFFRVLPIMVGESDKTATYASSEQMFLAHVTHTLGPWYARLEQQINLQLLTDEDRRDGLFVKFIAQGLMRGSHRDRSEFYRVLHGIGALNPNEIRDLEDRNPYPGGDMYLQPMNMEPAGTRGADDSGDKNL